MEGIVQIVKTCESHTTRCYATTCSVAKVGRFVDLVLFMHCPSPTLIPSPHHIASVQLDLPKALAIPIPWYDEIAQFLVDRLICIVIQE